MTLATQELLFRAGKEIALAWLDHNDIPRPIILAYNQAHTASPLVWYLKPGDRLEWDKKGLYFCGYCFANVAKTRTPSAAGDWPGYLVDDTALGVLAHEVGHYVWHWLQLKTEPWRECLRGDKCIGEFETDSEEAWAETLRLFILNPALLKAGLPRRWQWLIGPDIRLRPLPGLMRRGMSVGCAALDEEAREWAKDA